MNEIWVDALDCEGRTFRNVLGAFVTGVTVVATRGPDGQSRAFTANSFTSVSFKPPLVLVCLAKSSASLELFKQATEFSISVLGEGQRDISNTFASRDPLIKATANADLVGTGVPYVADSLVVLLCARDRLIDAGDHIILLGAVQQFHSSEGQPLGYFRGTYVGIGPAVRELEQLGAPLIVGAVLDADGRVVLRRKNNRNGWEIPHAPMPAGEQHGRILHQLFTDLGLTANVRFLYSLFQETDERGTTMMFSAEVIGPVRSGPAKDGSEIGLFGADDEPWALIRGEMKQSLLSRYFRERASGIFGMYFDTADGGYVVPLEGKPRAWTEWSTSQRPTQVASGPSKDALEPKTALKP